MVNDSEEEKLLDASSSGSMDLTISTRVSSLPYVDMTLILSFTGLAGMRIELFEVSAALGGLLSILFTLLVMFSTIFLGYSEL